MNTLRDPGALVACLSLHGRRRLRLALVVAQAALFAACGAPEADVRPGVPAAVDAGLDSGPEDGEAIGCLPGTVSSCYTGPPGTKGVGPCVAGTKTCLGDGSGYGPCEGEVTPRPESCETPVDDDCDGTTDDLDTTEWVKTFGGSGREGQYDSAVDAAANVYLTGVFRNSIDFGGGAIAGAGQNCFGLGPDCATVFLAKLDAAGGHVWSRAFGAGTAQFGHGVAVTPDGGVVMTGMVYGPAVDFGGGALASHGNYDVFVARYDAAGHHVWSRRDGSNGGDQGRSVAVDEAGRVYVAGLFRNTIAFDGETHTSAGKADIFLLALDADGNRLWSHSFGDANDNVYLQQGSTLSDPALATADGRVVMSASILGEIDLGGGPFPSSTPELHYEPVVAAYDAATGAHQWSHRFASRSGAAEPTLGAGALILNGYFQEHLNLGGTMLSNAGWGMFLARLGLDGTVLWARALGEGNTPKAFSTAAVLDDAGVLHVAGSLTGTVDFGAGPVQGDALFHGRFDAKGDVLSIKTFPSGQAALGEIHVTCGMVVGAGELHGTVDYGGGPVTTAGETDIVIARYAP